MLLFARFKVLEINFAAFVIQIFVQFALKSHWNYQKMHKKFTTNQTKIKWAVQWW